MLRWRKFCSICFNFIRVQAGHVSCEQELEAKDVRVRIVLDIHKKLDIHKDICLRNDFSTIPTTELRLRARLHRKFIVFQRHLYKHIYLAFFLFCASSINDCVAGISRGIDYSLSTNATMHSNNKNVISHNETAEVNNRLQDKKGKYNNVNSNIDSTDKIINVANGHKNDATNHIHKTRNVADKDKNDVADAAYELSNDKIDNENKNIKNVDEEIDILDTKSTNEGPENLDMLTVEHANKDIDKAIVENKNDYSVSRIAVVDIEYILDNSIAVKFVREEIQRINEDIRSRIITKENALREQEKSLAERKTAISEKDFEKEVSEFSKMVSDTQKEIQIEKAALSKAHIKSINLVHEKMVNLINEISKDNNLDLVLSGNQVIFKSDSLDITYDVLTQLNNNLKSVKVEYNPNQ